MLATFLALSTGSGIIALPIIMLTEQLGTFGPFVLALMALLFSLFLGRLFVVRQKHIESGVDDALAWQAIASAGMACWFLLDMVHVEIWSLWTLLGGLIIAMLFSVFYIHRVFALLAYSVALALIVWFVDFFHIDKLLLPFFSFPLSAMLYVVFSRMRAKSWYFYQPLFSLIRQLSLLVALLSFQPNVADLLWKLLLQQSTSFPLFHVFAGIFLVLTIGYLFVGWKKADVELLRIGVIGLLTALWSLLDVLLVPGEFQLLMGGALFGLGAYFTIQAMEKGQLTRFGFRKTDVGDLETILSHIVAEANKPATSAQQNMDMGGGEFGGAGASGNY